MRLHITVDDRLYEVDVAAPADLPFSTAPLPFVPKPGSSPTPSAHPQSNGNATNVCRSPMAGVVMKINAQVGQQLQANDLLLVLEAMKMETNVTAPVAGKVKAIRVEPGSAVQVDEVLVEFE